MDITYIELSKLHAPFTLLRPVRKIEVEYEELKTSIRKVGIMQTLVVRESPKVEGEYEVIDGMWRFSVAKDLTLPVAPCRIVVATDDEVLALQIMLNSTRYETTDTEYAKQIKVIIDRHASVGIHLTMRDLSHLTSKSINWLQSRLNLNSIEQECRDAFDAGEINLQHVAMLSRIRNPKVQLQLLPFAKDLTAREFELRLGKQLNEYSAEALNAAREKAVGGLRAHVRRRAEIMRELDSMEYISMKIVKEGLTNPLDVASAVLEWVLRLNPEVREGYEKSVAAKLTREQERGILASRRYRELEGIEEQARLRRLEKLEKLKNVQERIDNYGKRFHDGISQHQRSESGSGSSVEHEG